MGCLFSCFAPREPADFLEFSRHISKDDAGKVKKLLGAPGLTPAAVTAPEDKRTLLHEAAKYNRTNTMEVLLSDPNWRASVVATTTGGLTALHMAAEAGHEHAVALLLRAGANVDKKDQEGWTPLHRASKQGKESIVRLLLSHKADCNVPDQGGWTALHCAAAGGHVETTLKLLDGGADMYAKSQDGLTPVDVVSNNLRRHPENMKLGAVERILNKHMGDLQKKKLPGASSGLAPRSADSSVLQTWPSKPGASPFSNPMPGTPSIGVGPAREGHKEQQEGSSITSLPTVKQPAGDAVEEGESLQTIYGSRLLSWSNSQQHSSLEVFYLRQQLKEGTELGVDGQYRVVHHKPTSECNLAVIIEDKVTENQFFTKFYGSTMMFMHEREFFEQWSARTLVVDGDGQQQAPVPNVVRICQAGELDPEVKVPCIITALGQLSLEDLTEGWTRNNVPPQERCKGLLQILEAAAHALSLMHYYGFCHCNVKPSSIVFFQRSQTWKLVGFSRTVPAKTPVVVSADTFNCPPEVAVRMTKRTAKLTVRTSLDMWSLGLVMLKGFTSKDITEMIPQDTWQQMLVGQLLFPWDDDPDWLSAQGLPSNVTGILKQLLRRNPIKRLSAETLRHLLAPGGALLPVQQPTNKTDVIIKEVLNVVSQTRKTLDSMLDLTLGTSLLVLVQMWRLPWAAHSAGTTPDMFDKEWYAANYKSLEEVCTRQAAEEGDPG